MSHSILPFHIWILGPSRYRSAAYRGHDACHQATFQVSMSSLVLPLHRSLTIPVYVSLAPLDLFNTPSATALSHEDSRWSLQIKDLRCVIRLSLSSSVLSYSLLSSPCLLYSLILCLRHSLITLASCAADPHPCGAAAARPHGTALRSTFRVYVHTSHSISCLSPTLLLCPGLAPSPPRVRPDQRSATPVPKYDCNAASCASGAHLGLCLAIHAS